MTKDEIGRHFIDCPKFGGRRLAPTCVHFDRYKVCRRHCKSLQDHLKTNPGFADGVRDYFTERAKESGKASLFNDCKHSGKNLPDPHLACGFCKFIAKTARGLGIHYKRSHGGRRPKVS